MSRFSAAKKESFLGMPQGTASGRLRKALMFSMAQRLGEDKCFRCGLSIETPEDLSIDHKQAWEGVSTDLFWDLENIGFSHLDCNIKSQRRTLRPLLPPEGMAWCSGCRALHSVSAFGKAAERKEGIAKYCRLAQSRKNSLRPTTREGRKTRGYQC